MNGAVLPSYVRIQNISRIKIVKYKGAKDDIMTDEERRPGDWVHKTQRKDANIIVGKDYSKKWYQDTFWIIVLLVLFWPVGIVLCWRSSWPLWAKILATVLIAFFVYFAVSMQQAVMSMV